MTLCVAVTTADGLVMGADSMTLVRTGSQVKHYSNANKVFEVHGLPIVAMTYGLGAVGRRSIGSLIVEWSEKRDAFEKRAYTVEEVARSLSDFVFERHRRYRDAMRQQIEMRQTEALSGGQVEDLEPFDPLNYMTGLIVGGFQPDSRFPWLFTHEEPARSGVGEGLINARPHQGDDGVDGPDPGLDYWGDTRALDRLYRGFDSDFVVALRTIVDGGALGRIAVEHVWPVVFEGMPLQDAADLVQMMLEVGSGFERFKEGFPQIGGALDIAVVTQSRTHWASRKPMTSALAGFRHRISDSPGPAKSLE